MCLSRRQLSSYRFNFAGHSNFELESKLLKKLFAVFDCFLLDICLQFLSLFNFNFVDNLGNIFISSINGYFDKLTLQCFIDLKLFKKLVNLLITQLFFELIYISLIYHLLLYNFCFTYVFGFYKEVINLLIQISSIFTRIVHKTNSQITPVLYFSARNLASLQVLLVLHFFLYFLFFFIIYLFSFLI